MKFSVLPVRWPISFATGPLSEFPLLLWRRGLGRGGRLYRNLSVTILDQAASMEPARRIRPGEQEPSKRCAFSVFETVKAATGQR